MDLATTLILYLYGVRRVLEVLDHRAKGKTRFITLKFIIFKKNNIFQSENLAVRIDIPVCMYF